MTLNPQYHDPAHWTAVVMVDDGTGADAAAGDGVYTATIPGQAHRTLVRYRMTVGDALGASVTVPYADDMSLNFAYFYDGVPSTTGMRRCPRSRRHFITRRGHAAGAGL
jgi:hypothetical protein